MRRFAFIFLGKAHNIIESDVMPDWPPDPSGNKPKFVEILDDDVREGWIYDEEHDIFINPYPLDEENIDINNGEVE